jgi:EmrB/QacA subfamily drug resistance transporter
MSNVLAPHGRPAADLAFGSARGRAVLAGTVAASGMASLDATIINVALPHIGDEFDASGASLQWVLTGYLLALASLILLGGALGDRFGRRRVFLIGTAWFAVASISCALAPDVEVLIGARLLQGVGAALLTPGSLAILQASFREDDRAKAVGAWSGLGGVAGAVGPFAGGWLVDGPGWRWAFVLNVPIAGGVFLCARWMPETSDPNAARRLDIIGAGLAAMGLGFATWALTEAGTRGWTDHVVTAMALAAVACIVGFVVRMLHAAHPLVPPDLFGSRVFTVMNLATVLLYGALGVAFFLVAFQLQVGVGRSALEAGVALLPTTVLMLVGSSRSGELAQRVGPRFQLTAGPLLTAAGLLLLARIGPSATWVRDVLPGAALLGLGLVAFVAPLTETVLASVDPDHVNVASGVNNAVARTASLAALATIPVVSGLTRAVGSDMTTDAFRTAMVLAAVLAALAAPLSFVGLRQTRRPRRT